MKKEKAYIEKVYSNQEGEKPILLKFQNGSLADVSSTHFCKIEHKNKRKGALVVADKNIYHGFFNEDAGEELTDSYICIRNRRTDKVRIIPIEQVTLKNHIYNVLEQTQVSKLTDETSQTTLLKQFGGRKAARYVTNAAKMKMNIDVLKDELDETINESSINEADDSITTQEYSEFLRPKYNPAAMKIQEIYNIADVVPQELLERLEEEAKVVLSTKIEDLPISSDYIKEKIKQIQKDTPSIEKTLQVKLFIYMDALSNLIKSRARKLEKLELSKITEKVENDIRARFSDPHSKNMLRTKLSTEKAICHFIVLSLITSENYSIDADILAQEIGIAKPRISKFANVSFVKKKAGSNMFSLTLPSLMPKQQTRTRKK